MPNHVSNQIEFFCDQDQANTIIAEIGKEKRAVDFETLIPSPLTKYIGDLSRDDDDDFEHHTWHKWNTAHWGTKWNAYNGDAEYRDGKVTIYFETAWSIPYPFIIAFANKYGLDFTHKYYDEGDNFWGVETWRGGKRITRNRDPEDIKRDLHIELKGYDPDAEDECA